MRKLIALGSSVVLCVALTACGGDDDDDDAGGGGSASEFCDDARDLEDETADPTSEEGLDLLRDVADNAPSEISDDLDTLIEAVEAFQDGDTEAAASEEVSTAAGNISTYLEEECGITEDTTE